MNVFNATGYLGRDAEQRFTTAGDSVVNFSIAVKAGYGDKETTVWPNCAMWGKRGEAVLPYLHKGQLVAISGELSMREYKDKEGNTRTSLDVRVNDLTLLGKSDGAAKQSSDKPSSTNRHEDAQKDTGGFDDMDDVPF